MVLDIRADPSAPLDAHSRLADWLAGGERSPERFAVGTEYEKLAVHARDGAPLPYAPDGERPGIGTLLEAMRRCESWAPVHEGGALIALASADASITLEPGGQFEMSGGAFRTIDEMVRELRRHELELGGLAAGIPVRWLWVGANPVHGLDEIGWMPKGRYDVMRRYLPTRGRLGLHMMKATCTVQANLDYGSEPDMGAKLRTAMGIAPIVTAMFANSPLQLGRPSGYKTFRGHIWTDVDPDRCGLLEWVFDGELPTYERYVAYALDVPLFFIVRDGRIVECAGLPFRRFLERGLDGHRATLEDWQLHLSTLFPEVRLKTYLETRMADCVAPELVPALPALFKGVLYDETARRAAWDLVASFGFADRVAHREAVTRLALDAPSPAGHPTSVLARELVAIARDGLARIALRCGHANEGRHLDPLERLVAEGISPADRTLAWFEATRPGPRAILAHYQGTAF